MSNMGGAALRSHKKVKASSGVTLLFEHSPSQSSEIGHSEIFSHLQENKLTHPTIFRKI